MRELNVPDEQEVQDDCPGNEEKEPVGHGIKLAVAAGQLLPAGHDTQLD
jgi:hypothetical protein